MMTRNASKTNSVLLTRSYRTRRPCFADVEAVKRVETSVFPRFSVPGHSARLRPVLAITRR